MTGQGAAPELPEVAGSRAVFLDRDGTLIEELRLVTRPDEIVILPDVAGALRELREAGYRLIVVTNQSAIARGLLDEAALEAVHGELSARLARLGTPLDGIYFSPDGPDPEADVREPLARRKPGAGLLIQAAQDHRLVLSQCWMIGNQLRDAIAGRRAGCRGSLLVRTGPDPRLTQHADGVFTDLAEAARFITGQDAARPAGSP